MRRILRCHAKRDRREVDVAHVDVDLVTCHRRFDVLVTAREIWIALIAAGWAGVRSGDVARDHVLKTMVKTDVETSRK